MITTKPLRCILGFHDYDVIFHKKIAEGVEDEPIELVRHTLRCQREGCTIQRTQTLIIEHGLKEDHNA